MNMEERELEGAKQWALAKKSMTRSAIFVAVPLLCFVSFLFYTLGRFNSCPVIVERVEQTP